ncbi:MAG: hypothetical protein J6C85_00280 [Alphaproteobacteria bacterium]|nr:hypothetical protein [Alphaproteobacteria bacterium]
MQRIALTFWATFFLLIYCTPVFSQVLDDEEVAETKADAGSAPVLDEVDEDEALFNEMFSDYSETERDITKVKTFNDAMDRAADLIGQTDTTAPLPEEQKALPPLEGDMSIGLLDGSFKIFRDMSGQTSCSFSVILKSDMNRVLKQMGLNLFYKQRTFAFLFRDVPAYGTQIRSITTRGDICYTLAGEPDIGIHLCKIYGPTAPGNECVRRLKWVEKLRDERQKK